MRVDFYLLKALEAEPSAESSNTLLESPSSTLQAPSPHAWGEGKSDWLLACRLLEKAYARGHRVFVYCNNIEDAHGLDELLWTYKEDSFIPHNLQGEGPEPPPAVQIGYGAEPRDFNDILLNMSQIIPTFHTRFRRIIEVVNADEAAKTISRAHFREYRKLGYEILTHKV